MNKIIVISSAIALVSLILTAIEPQFIFNILLFAGLATSCIRIFEESNQEWRLNFIKILILLFYLNSLVLTNSYHLEDEHFISLSSFIEMMFYTIFLLVYKEKKITSISILLCLFFSPSTSFTNYIKVAYCFLLILKDKWYERIEEYNT